MHAKLVPENNPSFSGFNIEHWHSPFEGIPGGDFIDYFQLDETHLAVILGDVMGKRWGAWYFAYAYAGYVRSSLRGVLEDGDISSPSRILEKLNKSIYQDSKIAEVFTTLSFLVLDNENLTASYSGAGDLPILYRRSEDSLVTKIQSEGLLLGFSENGEFSDSVIRLKSSDNIVLATDGIIESTNSSNNPFGTKRLIDTLQKFPQENGKLDLIKKEVSEFAGNKFEDDISLILITAT
jgi:sigma-B regulation protein RsbU (phosphoserine phosphatase)